MTRRVSSTTARPTSSGVRLLLIRRAACWRTCSWALRRASAARARPTSAPVTSSVPPIVRSSTRTTSSSDDGPPCIAQPAMPRSRIRTPPANASACSRAWPTGRCRTTARRTGTRRVGARTRCVPARRGSRGTDPKVPRAAPDPAESAARAGSGTRPIRAVPASRRATRRRRPWPTAAGRRRATRCRCRGRPSGSRTRPRGCRAPCRSTRSRRGRSARRSRGRTSRAPRTGAAHRPMPSTATCRPERRRPGPDVDRDHERPPGHDPHELALGRVPLEVEAADHAPRRARLVDLDEAGRAGRRRAPRTPGPGRSPRTSPARRGTGAAGR